MMEATEKSSDKGPPPTPLGEVVLRVEDLSASHDGDAVTANVDFQVRAGEIVGLLGPNGAGKSSLFAVIAGLLQPLSGRVRIGEFDTATQPVESAALLGLVPQEIALHEELSAKENLQFWGGMQGLRGEPLNARVHDLLQRVGLDTRAHEPIHRLSGGMKRRLNLAVALMSDPRLLLLDEPTVGIDPRARTAIQALVRDEAERGLGVLYATHHCDEAERVCDRILLMDQGRLLAAGSPKSLIEMLGDGKIVTLRGQFQTGCVEEIVGPVDGVSVFSFTPERVLLSVARGAIPALFGLFTEHALKADELSVREPDLASVFLKLTGRELRE